MILNHAATIASDRRGVVIGILFGICVVIM